MNHFMISAVTGFIVKVQIITILISILSGLGQIQFVVFISVWESSGGIEK